MTEIHTFTTTLTETANKTFEGVAAPYNSPTSDGRKVIFASGLFGNISDLPLCAIYSEHPLAKGEPAVRIGRVDSWTDMPDGLHFSASLNDSEAAEAAYALLKSGQVSSVSVGVYANETTEADGVTTFVSAELLELSIVQSPAFSDAKILLVHSMDEASTSEAPAAEEIPTIQVKESQMDLENVVSELAGTVEDLSREVATFSANNASNTPTGPTIGANFECFGDYVKAVARGDDDAERVYEAFAMTSADTVVKNGWVDDAIVRVNKPRRLINAFSKGRLPEEGNNIEYVKLDSSTLQADIQSPENSNLVVGKLDFGTATAPVVTIGGAADSVSRQTIERSSINVVSEIFEGLASAYGLRSETYMRAAYLSASSTSVTGVNKSNPDHVTGFIVDAAGALEDNGVGTADFIVLSRDVYKTLATTHVGTNGDFFLNRSQGTVNLVGLTGDLAGLPFVVIGGVTNHLAVCNRDALRTYESAGAPFRLQQDKILNLSKDFAVYGYLSVANRIQNAIVKAA